MPHHITVHPDDGWLAITFHGIVDGADLVASRATAAAMNDPVRFTDFIVDYTKVTEFVLDPPTTRRIQQIDQARSGAIPGGRCAVVAIREFVRTGALFLSVVSELDLDFRLFASRHQAEAWLRGEAAEEPPRLTRFPRRPPA